MWQRAQHTLILQAGALGRDARKGKGGVLKDRSVQLSPREQQIIELLLLGCGNAEIARELKIAGRTVKAHFNRLFLRFGLNDGIKRVKLATMMYRRQISQPIDILEEPRQSEPEGIAMPLCK